MRCPKSEPRYFGHMLYYTTLPPKALGHYPKTGLILTH